MAKVATRYEYESEAEANAVADRLVAVVPDGYDAAQLVRVDGVFVTVNDREWPNV